MLFLLFFPPLPSSPPTLLIMFCSDLQHLTVTPWASVQRQEECDHYLPDYNLPELVEAHFGGGNMENIITKVSGLVLGWRVVGVACSS